MSKNKLGRGLDSLLEIKPNTNTAAKQGRATNTSAASEPDIEKNIQTVKKVDPRILKPNPHQPRTVFSETALAELANSIKEHGIIQPVVVTEEENGELFILAGERRTRASIMAGLQEIPVIVADIAPEQNLELALIENIQRENLNPIEEALACKKLLEMYDLSQDELAKKLGKSRPAVTNVMRLLQLPDFALEAVQSGSLTSGHARAILSVVLKTEQKKLFDKIMSEGLSVRQAEQYAAKLNAGEKENGLKHKPDSAKTLGGLSPELQSMQQKFLEAFGTKVIIKGTESSGTLEISYFSKDDLHSIYEKIVQE
ncbi:MAG: ParB/RepB/Spo0J family partition protein [Treponemataceae bacterium]